MLTCPAQAEGRYPAGLRWSWGASLVLYVIFSAVVFVIQGRQPLLGPDHITYFQLADAIMEAHPSGDYWRETDSVRSFGVLLAYLYPWTGSHLLSMKLLLAAVTVAYLMSAELLFGLFAERRWQAVAFALLSAFAVSFGISSWGVTDSTALLSRSLVAPIVLLSVWFWFRFYDSNVKYLAFSFLMLGSLLHLSTFYVMGILGFLELWDFVAMRKLRIDAQVPAFIGGVVLAAALLYALETLSLSVNLIHSTIPHLFSATKVAVAPTNDVSGAAHRKKVVALSLGGTVTDAPGAGEALSSGARSIAKAISAKEAWALELRLRPWRNMPLQWVNIANVLSSFALVLILALAGVRRRKAAGWTRMDRIMGAMFVVIPAFAFLPQTLLWILRSFTDIYPATMEEVRAIGFIMIPALYFVMRLFQHVLATGGAMARVKAGGIALAVIALPLATKSLPVAAREGIFSGMASLGLVNPSDPSSATNARSALGISHTSPFYHSAEGVISWLRENTSPGTRILTDRDELLLLREREIVGPRQVAAVPPRAGVELPDLAQLYFWTQQALRDHDIARLEWLTRMCGADFIVVPWHATGAIYTDSYFSVVPVGKDLRG
jgi:hypothetical protein